MMSRESHRCGWPELAGGGRCFLLLIFCALGGCSPRSDAEAHRLGWSFGEQWTLDGSGSRGISLSYLAPYQVASDRHSRLFVLGGAEHRVYIVDSLGSVRDTLGREGHGPGEFEGPEWIAITGNGDLVVGDLATRTLLRWTPDGQFVESTPFRLPAFGADVRMVPGAIWYTMLGAGAAGGSETRLMRSSPAGEARKAAVVRQPRRVGDFPRCHAYQISVQPLFAPRLVWDAAANYAAVATGETYLIERFENGKLVDTVHRDIPPASATHQLAEREAGHWLMNGCLVPPAHVVAVTGFMARVPVIDELRVSPSGELWVRHRDRSGNPGGVDVFDSSGAYLGTLPPSAPFPAAFLSGDRIVAIGKDSMDVPTITAYRIHR